MKKYLVISVITVFLIVLFGASSMASAASIDVKGDLRVTFNLNQFDLNRLALRWNAGLGPDNGVEGEFRFGGTASFFLESAYFYQKGLFLNTDVMQVGRFPISWSSEKSATIMESLADALEPANGTGVKYQISLDNLSIASSLSGGSKEEPRLDLAARIDVPVFSDLNLGIGLAAVNSIGDSDRIVFDATYKPNNFQILGEFVFVSNAGSDWESGFYIEGAVNISLKFQAYVGVCQAEKLEKEWILLGGKYKLANNVGIQGEYRSFQNDNEIIFRFQVDF